MLKASSATFNPSSALRQKGITVEEAEARWKLESEISGRRGKGEAVQGNLLETLTQVRAVGEQLTEKYDPEHSDKSCLRALQDCVPESGCLGDQRAEWHSSAPVHSRREERASSEGLTFCLCLAKTIKRFYCLEKKAGSQHSWKSSSSSV